MKKICRSVSIMLVMAMVLVGCGKTDTPDTEVNTQQMETESSATNQDKETSSATSETTETEITTEIETEVQTEVESETQTENEVSSEPEAPTYTYTDMDKTMWAKSSVNVRDLPSTDGNKLGGLSKAQEVHVTGQCNETNWYRIEYSGSVGYVSNNYLQETKPVEEEPTQPSEPTVESFPYALNSPWYDASTNSVYYYLIGTNWDENGTYTTYMTACDLYDQNSNVGDVHTVEGPYFVGKYIEGDIYKIRVYKFIVN